MNQKFDRPAASRDFHEKMSSEKISKEDEKLSFEILQVQPELVRDCPEKTPFESKKR